MKHFFFLLATMLVLNARPVLANAPCNDDDDPRDHFPAHILCEKAFIKDAFDCHTSVQNLKINARVKAELACLKDATISRRQCVSQNGSGSDACQSTCTNSYTSAVTTCNTNFDPTVCGTDAGCQASILQSQSDCISTAQATLNSCTSACPANQ